jgi:alanine adding enzyme
VQLTNLQKQILDLEKEIAETDSAKKKKRNEDLKNQALSLEKRVAEAKENLEKYGEKDILMAAALFMYGASENVYLSSGSYEEFKAFNAPFAIQDYVMSKSIQNHVPSYNFFGIQGKFDGSDGVLRFKENFSGYVARKVGYFCYYPAPLKHKMLSGFKKMLRRD